MSTIKENSWVIFKNNPFLAYKVDKTDNTKHTPYIKLLSTDLVMDGKWFPMTLFNILKID